MVSPKTAFISRPDMYYENIDNSLGTHARPVYMSGAPDGGLVPAVAIFQQRYLRGIVTLKDATRLSNELVDAVEEHETGVRSKYEPRPTR